MNKPPAGKTSGYVQQCLPENETAAAWQISFELAADAPDDASEPLFLRSVWFTAACYAIGVSLTQFAGSVHVFQNIVSGIG